VYNSTKRLTFARESWRSHSIIIRILRPAGKTPRRAQCVRGRTPDDALQWRRLNAGLVSATFAPRSSCHALGTTEVVSQSPVRPHLHAWMLREGEADLINRDRHSGGRTGEIYHA
jgi:hypothetical protein